MRPAGAGLIARPVNAVSAAVGATGVCQRKQRVGQRDQADREHRRGAVQVSESAHLALLGDSWDALSRSSQAVMAPQCVDNGAPTVAPVQTSGAQVSIQAAPARRRFAQ